MPKYYIQDVINKDNVDRVIIDAESPVLACARALVNRKLKSFIINGSYLVSERGFDYKSNPFFTQKISSDEVNEVAMSLFYNKGEEST